MPDFSSQAGRLAIFFGFFLFAGVTVTLIMFVLVGRAQHREGLMPIDPWWWTGMLALLLVLAGTIVEWLKH